MSAQLDLLTGKPAAPPAKPLTERQQQVLDLVEASGTEGVQPGEVGSLLHELRGRHPREQRCGYCPDDGKQALRALQKQKWVVRRRSGRWTVPKPKPPVRGSDDLPDGF